MRRVLKTLAIHSFCILLFAFFYYYFSKHFDNSRQNKFTYYNTEPSQLETLIDFFLFSTTIQAGVGISDIIPISIYGKTLMIIQQLIMISINVITIYVFTQ
jgi:hypothetical protein